MTGIFIVKQLGAAQSFESRKNPGQSVTCADAVLREMGSPDYADSFKVRLFGKNATNPPMWATPFSPSSASAPRSTTARLTWTAPPRS